MPQKPIKQQFAESRAMLHARDRAQQTPDEVRQAFLARRRTIGPVYVEPFSLGILWLFEQLKHPFNEPQLELDGDGKPMPLLDEGGAQKLDANGRPQFKAVPLSIQDTARAIYVFHDSESAAEALAEGVDTFDSQAMGLVRGIDPAFLPEISAVIAQTFAEGLATIPGAGAANPPRTGS